MRSRGRVRAAASLGLSGRYAVQAHETRAGLRLWASDAGVDLALVDDGGSSSRAAGIYRALLKEGTEILLGPYGSDMVRRVGPLVSRAGRVLWNHGGAADDLPSPGLASVVAPASSYLRTLVGLAHDMGLDEVVVATGRGRFARQVGDGALRTAAAHGMRTRHVAAGEWDSLVEGGAGAERADAGQPSFGPDRLPRNHLGSRKARVTASLEHAVLAFVGTFEDDVAAVARVRDAGRGVGLLGCVAAGIEEFGRRLGSRADGVVGPVQWWDRDEPVEVGPSGPAFVRRFEQRFGRRPDYVAAQAAAAGYLALEAHRRGYGPAKIHRWHTSSLLGPFRLDHAWRQVGHIPATVQWRNGRRVLADPPHRE